MNRISKLLFRPFRAVGLIITYPGGRHARKLAVPSPGLICKSPFGAKDRSHLCVKDRTQSDTILSYSNTPVTLGEALSELLRLC